MRQWKGTLITQVVNVLMDCLYYASACKLLHKLTWAQHTSHTTHSPCLEFDSLDKPRDTGTAITMLHKGRLFTFGFYRRCSSRYGEISLCRCHHCRSSEPMLPQHNVFLDNLVGAHAHMNCCAESVQRSLIMWPLNWPGMCLVHPPYLELQRQKEGKKPTFV